MKLSIRWNTASDEAQHPMFHPLRAPPLPCATPLLSGSKPYQSHVDFTHYQERCVFGPFQNLSAPFGFCIRICFCTLPNVIRPHLDSIHCQSKGFRNLPSLSAPFGFLYAISNMGFRTVPNLISPIWILLIFKNMGFWNLANLISPILILYILKDNKFLDDPSLLHLIWILYILKKKVFGPFQT